MRPSRAPCVDVTSPSADTSRSPCALRQPAPVLLKEHLRGAEALAHRELAAYAALAAPPALAPRGANAAADSDAYAYGFALRAEEARSLEAPLAPVLGYFLAPSPEKEGAEAAAPRGDDEGEAPLSLWVVQRWEGLRTLEEYPAAPQPRAAAPRWWPPVQRVADAPGAARARFVATAAARAVGALAHCHARRVAHGALDARALLLSTADDASPNGATVRLANFGFSVVGGPTAAPRQSADRDTPDADAEAADDAAAALAAAAQSDCRALGLALAELVFAALSLEGPGPRTAAPALARIFDDIFARDWRAIAAFCAEEPAWGPPCALLGARGGAGWALLAALTEEDTYSADAPRVLAAAAQLAEAVRVDVWDD